MRWLKNFRTWLGSVTNFSFRRSPSAMLVRVTLVPENGRARNFRQALPAGELRDAPDRVESVLRWIFRQTRSERVEELRPLLGSMEPETIDEAVKTKVLNIPCPADLAQHFADAEEAVMVDTSLGKL